MQVTWRPLPAVTFSVSGGNPNLCPGDCRTIQASFTGTPPFTLTYTSPLTGVVTQPFAANTGTFQVCAPANTTPGPLQLAATAVVDGWCTCQ